MTIYGHPKQGQKKFIKAAVYDKGERRIANERDPVEHARQRKLLSNAFSARALRDQEVVIHHYVDLLVQQLNKLGSGGSRPVDVSAAWNWLTFDVIGDLAYGESFGAIAEGSSYWSSLILDAILWASVVRLMKRNLIFKLVLPFFWPKGMEEKLQKHKELAVRKAKKRLELGTSLDRQDFFSHLIKENALTERSLIGNARSLLVAGSETTASGLAGITYHLLRNPTCLAKLYEEVRSAFGSYEQITGDSTAALPYLHGAIEEGLRLFPPVAFGLPRDCPGAVIDGVYIPEGVVVATENYAISRDPRYWADPESFRPERWIGEGLGDDKRAFQPFSTGPRACLGLNLAYLEMRIALAKVIFVFDLEMVSEIDDWTAACKSYGMWKKPELLVKFRPREKLRGLELVG
ncbi:hypothetical protein KVR01_006059 [Diaporthe batatas]|uniref:uncharacterized protein n=1 Tax=Diaporthe batatas TaxID=748121 RepID=UPI001D042838|nr:uncharacterized protein KVR01_006059 [Diaporthe batatas]KAG8164141.1 hypothetical protein KVR01_006059 [Diaporthe batatas]